MTKNLPERKIRLSQEVLATEILSGVTLGTISPKLKAIQAFQQLVRGQLKPNLDYGIIPGTQKPSLWKPGAEKIAKLLNCADKYEILEKIEDWVKPLFSYKIKCQLIAIATGVVISEGVGECNSMESKYRYRWVKESLIPKHLFKEDLVIKTIKTKTGGQFTLYRIDNDDIYTQINTILKMSKKRALVDASLSAGRLSDIFTQDIDEIIDIEGAEVIPNNGDDKPKNKLPENMPEQIAVTRKKVGDEIFFKVLGEELSIDKVVNIPNIETANKLIRRCGELHADRLK